MLMLHCVKCNQATEMMSVNEVCEYMKKSRAAIYRWISGQNLHLNKDGGGRLLICKTSLLTPCNNTSRRKRTLRLL
jgi:excisionase family DNA binding protein